jgi:hypothetical protein
MDKKKHCYKCATAWEGKGQPGSRDRCFKCGEDLHVCLNCRFYNDHKPDKCLVPDIDPVLYKDRANFCDEFQFAESAAAGGEDEAAKAKDAWKKLFKK